MQLKPIPAIIVLSLVVASLLVSGCTTSTTNQTPSANATSGTAAHDALLEKLIEETKNETYSAYNDSTLNVTAWKTTWINSTAARVEWSIIAKSANETATGTGDLTYIVFPTTQDATQYLAAMNKTGYNQTNLTATEFSSLGGPYQNATGHAPQVYKLYTRTEGALGQPGFTSYGIAQFDNIIMVSTGKVGNITTQRAV